MKKYLLLLTMLLICINIFGCNSKTITQVSYSGESPHWQATMKFNESDKYILNIKYLGKEQFPLEVKFNIEYLSYNASGGVLEYGELSEKLGGFTFEQPYDKDIYGSVAKSKNKDKLNVILKWNNYEETIELNKVETEVK